VTSRERFLTVIDGNIPDRVPVTLFIAEQGHFISQLYPDIDPWDIQTLQCKVIEVQKQLGCDVFVRLLYGVNDPLHIHMGGVDISQETDTWQVSTEDIRNGDTLIKRSVITTPDGTLTQDFSINEMRAGTFMFACTKKPVEKEADLDILIKYEPRMPAEWPEQMKSRVRPVRAALGDDGILGAWAPHGPFNNASLLIKLDELYALFLVDPGYYDKLMTYASDRIIDYTRAIDSAGVDVHCVGGNVPGGFLGKRFYDEYILPYEKRYIDIVQENGTPAMYHNCGEIMNLVESYKDLGARIVEPFSPPPLGDTDLRKAKELVGDSYVMVGGVDHVNIIQNGSIDEIRRATEETVRIGKPGGGFILQTADFVEYGTPVEHIEAFVKTGIEHGGY
jgi:uroporphyrinogen decarboxylase